MVKDAIEEGKYFRTHALVCHFNGFWPQLANLRKWISKEWNPLLEGESYIFPCACGFFIVGFDEYLDRYIILNSGHWF